MNTAIRRVLVLTLVFLFFLSFIPQDASAFPYRIKGYVWDEEGKPIPGGNISVTGDVYNPDIQDYEKGTLWALTDNTGFYQLFPESDPSYGGFSGPIVISYNPLNGDDGVSRTVSYEGTNIWGNLTCEEKVSAIDLISSPVGLVSIVILVSAVFIGYYMYKSGTGDSANKEEKESSKRVDRRR